MGFRLRISVSALLAGMVALPLMGTVAASGALIQAEQKREHAARMILADASELETLTSLNVGLRTESSMAFLLVAGRKFDIPIAVGSAMVGFDIEDRHRSAMRDVDNALDRLGASAPIDRKALDKGRDYISSDAMMDLESDVYASLLVASEAGIDEQLDSLRASSSSFGFDQALVDAASVNEHAVKALSIGLNQVGPAAATVVGFEISEKSRIRLIASTANLATELNLLTEGRGSNSEFAQRARAIESSEAHSLITAFAEGDVVSEGSLSPQTWALLGAISDRSEAMIDLASHTTDATAARATTLADAAQGRVRQFTAIVIAATLLSIAAAFVFGRQISRALRRLERRAEELLGGSAPTAPLPERGPREIAVMASAMNQLVAEYQLLGRQTEALADGSAADDVVHSTPSGPLGRAVHEAVQRLASSVKENEQRRISLKHEATHDALTGILNRSGVIESITVGLARGAGYVLLFVDLDHFKDVNDRFGHQIGDEVLRQAVERLRRCSRDGDTVGRLGGDEFVIGCVTSSPLEPLAQIGERIVVELSRPFEIASHTVSIGASVGVAYAEDGDDAEALLARADKSLYAAKDAGRGRVGAYVR
jgi:diguanylate cyclase (GGDEF)-like protein